MADIIDLIRADHMHIVLWQSELGDRARPGSDPGNCQALASTWSALANLIDLHMKAEDEIFWPAALRDAETPDGARQRNAADAHEDIREFLRESYHQPPGSPLWQELVTTALAAWTAELDRQEHDLLEECRYRIAPALRERLGRQWRAFMEARIRDQIPDAPSQTAACQLCRARPGTAPPVLAKAFDPVYCTCDACDDMLDRFLPGATRGTPETAGPSA